MLLYPIEALCACNDAWYDTLLDLILITVTVAIVSYVYDWENPLEIVKKILELIQTPSKIPPHQQHQEVFKSKFIPKHISFPETPLSTSLIELLPAKPTDPTDFRHNIVTYLDWYLSVIESRPRTFIIEKQLEHFIDECIEYINKSYGTDDELKAERPLLPFKDTASLNDWLETIPETKFYRKEHEILLILKEFYAIALCYESRKLKKIDRKLRLPPHLRNRLRGFTLYELNPNNKWAQSEIHEY